MTISGSGQRINIKAINTYMNPADTSTPEVTPEVVVTPEEIVPEVTPETPAVEDVAAAETVA
jgi:hypothetical protein